MPYHLPARRLIALACLAVASTLLAPARAADPSPRTSLNFDNDWRFFKGEPPAPPSTAPARGNYPPVDPPSHAFKDDTWRKLNLPHDWSIEGPFDENAPSLAAGAFLPTGISWYRKTFTLPPEAKGKRVYIEFDGVMANAEVYINKATLGQHPNGYLPFRHDLTDYLDPTGPNILAVRTDTSRQPASRWYAGAGIYRHTRLVFESPIHLEHNATIISTPTVSAERATVKVRTAVSNQSAAPAEVSLDILLNDGLEGADRAPTSTPKKTIAPNTTETFELELPITAPRLWDTTTPNLYTASIVVREGANTPDLQTFPFGIRAIEFKSDTGFWLNGKNLKLKGVALHHDVGALGAAVPAAAWESRLLALKKVGVNAIRAAHAPMGPEFYDLCDKLGLIVMDELFDTWTVGKEPADYHLYFKDWAQRDLDTFITSRRNHPSIVIWSLGNEIWDILPQNPDPALDQFTGPKRSIDIAKNIFIPLRDRTHQLDPTRPVTLAVMRANVNNTYTNGFADLMDVIGQNYRDAELAAAHKQNPARKIIATESYKTRDAWLALRDNPALAGQFLWAGVDYLGEAAAWPNTTSPSGILDRTNFPKGEALERDAWWSATPVLHLARMVTIPTRPGAATVNMGFADWTPPTPGAQPETVTAYSNCDEVELFLNDKSLGSKPKDPKDAPRQWQLPFTPGTLKAVAKNKGEIVATDELKTATAPTKLLLKAERATLKNDWDDVVYVRAFIADAAGTTNPNATNKISFAISGPGAIIAVDSGSLSTHEPFQATAHSAHQGTCIAILRATADSGQFTLTATAEGLQPATTTLNISPK